MARPIKETPILRGKDAEDFLWHLDHPTPISNDEKVRAYSAAKDTFGVGNRAWDYLEL